MGAAQHDGAAPNPQISHKPGTRPHFRRRSPLAVDIVVLPARRSELRETLSREAIAAFCA